MKTFESILFYYGISEFYFKDDIKAEIIIVKKNKNLTINEWINMINTLKYFLKKEIEFLFPLDESFKEEFNYIRSGD